MSIDHSNQESQPLLGYRFLKQSHRTIPEQLVGLGIYLFICLGFMFLASLPIQATKPVQSQAFGACSAAYYVFLALSIWGLWRRYSLLALKLEVSVFLGQFLFQMIWSITYYLMNETLFALVAILLLWCNTLLAVLLFWKKEKTSAILLSFPLIWIFYLAGMNMIICISNP